MLVDLRERYPHSEIVVLSALAEGADRLVARIAVALGMRLVVPMPLEQSDYESDFTQPGSLDEFRDLLAQADSVFVVPPIPGSIDEAERRDARSRAYANGGAYLVRKCVQIVALWDGVSEPPRGTAEVIAFALEGIPAPYISRRRELDVTMVGTVTHIETPRRSEASSMPAAPSVRTLYPHLFSGIDPAAAFDKAKADIDRFNRDALALSPAHTSVRDAAAAVATAYQARTHWALRAIFVLIFFSVVGFNVYTSFEPHAVAVLVAYLACVAGAFGAYFISRRGDWQNRYQDGRAFSEVLRVAHYWRMAGIDEPVADVFEENHRAEIDWLPSAIRAVTEPFADVRSADASVALVDLRRVYGDWIGAEFEYFTNYAGRRDRRRSVLSDRVVSAALAASIGLTIAMRSLPGAKIAPVITSEILAAATLLAIFAALLNNYAEKRGWAEHVRRYERMALLFGLARERIGAYLEHEPDAYGLRRIRGIMRSLGEESLRESATWLSLHRSRPINVPQA